MQHSLARFANNICFGHLGWEGVVTTSTAQRHVPIELTHTHTACDTRHLHSPQCYQHTRTGSQDVHSSARDIARTHKGVHTAVRANIQRRDLRHVHSNRSSSRSTAVHQATSTPRSTPLTSTFSKTSSAVGLARIPHLSLMRWPRLKPGMPFSTMNRECLPAPDLPAINKSINQSIQNTNKNRVGTVHTKSTPHDCTASSSSQPPWQHRLTLSQHARHKP